MNDAKKFQVGRAGNGIVATLPAMLADNASDEAFCAWARNAKPGDEFPDGEGCVCLASPPVIFNPLAEVIAAIDKASADAQRWAGI